MKSYIVAILAVLGLAATSLSDEAGRTNSASSAKVAPAPSIAPVGGAEKREAYTVIGYLVGRDRVITLKSSARGPVYSVATKAGKVLFDNVSLEQLKAQAPEVHDQIKGSIAGGSPRQRAVLDASARPRF